MAKKTPPKRIAPKTPEPEEAPDPRRAELLAKYQAEIEQTREEMESDSRVILEAYRSRRRKAYEKLQKELQELD